MSNFSLSCEQTRLIDQYIIHEIGLPSVILMENAGHGIAQHLLSFNPKGKIIVCCGKGNNGGDGYVIARYLNIYGIKVQVFVFSHENDIKGDAKIHHDVIKKIGIPLEYFDQINLNHSALLQILNNAEWVIDGIFGTGLSGKIDPFYFELINTINKTSAKILSIDIPSGLNCNTGKPFGTAIEANITCTLLSMKTGFLNEEAQKYLGKVEVINLGIANQVILLSAIQNRVSNHEL